jgi:hypothetical protein
VGDPHNVVSLSYRGKDNMQMRVIRTLKGWVTPFSAIETNTFVLDIIDDDNFISMFEMNLKARDWCMLHPCSYVHILI